MRRRQMFGLILGMLLAAAWVGATPAPEGKGRRDRMRTFLVFWIAEALDLPEEKALQVGKVLRGAEDKRQDLTTQRRDLERGLRSALEQVPLDQSAVAALIAHANEIDSHIALIPENTFRDVQGLLTVEQQGKLILLRPELQAQLRRSVERRLREHRAAP